MQVNLEVAVAQSYLRLCFQSLLLLDDFVDEPLASLLSKDAQWRSLRSYVFLKIV